MVVCEALSGNIVRRITGDQQLSLENPTLVANKIDISVQS